MKEEILDKLRQEKFNQEKTKNDYTKKLQNLKKARDIVKNNIFVNEYLKAEKRVVDMEKTICDSKNIDSILLEYYDSIALDDSTNKIYFYLGSFIGNAYNNRQVKRDNIYEEADYNLYIDIESQDIVHVKIDNYGEFENNNNIIISSDFPDEYEFLAVRKSFFMDAIENGQEKACVKVLNKYKRY